jgi:hypothetical protein
MTQNKRSRPEVQTGMKVMTVDHQAADSRSVHASSSLARNTDEQRRHSYTAGRRMVPICGSCCGIGRELPQHNEEYYEVVSDLLQIVKLGRGSIPTLVYSRRAPVVFSVSTSRVA